MESPHVARLIKKINYLNRSGIGVGVAYLLLSPEYFDVVKLDLGTIVAIDYDAVNHIEFFLFKGHKVGKHGDIRGDYIMPSICRTKKH